MSQDYLARVHEIDVILGNSALLKCEIPSYVIDFVSVISWLSDSEEYSLRSIDGTLSTGHFLVTGAHKPILIGLKLTTSFAVVSQDYATRVNDFDVILGNSALMKCEIPSFVADFVSVINWSDHERELYSQPNALGSVFPHHHHKRDTLAIKMFLLTSFTLFQSFLKTTQQGLTMSTS